MGAIASPVVMILILCLIFYLAKRSANKRK